MDTGRNITEELPVGHDDSVIEKSSLAPGSCPAVTRPYFTACSVLVRLNSWSIFQSWESPVRLESIHVPPCKHGQVTGLEGEGLIPNSFLVSTVLSPVHPKSILFQKNTEKSLLERQILVPHP